MPNGFMSAREGGKPGDGSMLKPPPGSIDPLAAPKPFFFNTKPTPMGYSVLDTPQAMPKPQEAPEEMIDLTDSQNIKTGKYPKKAIVGAIAAAKAAGIDPYKYLSWVMQESGFGTAEVRTRRGKFTGGWAGVKGSDLEESQHKEIDAMTAKTGLPRNYVEAAMFLKDKLAYGEHIAKRRGKQADDAFLMQALNGYGVISPAQFHGATKAYGVDITKGVDMAENPLGGKRYVSLMNDLRKNPQIAKLLSE